MRQNNSLTDSLGGERNAAMENTPAIKQVSFFANHPPRLCGIATFTSDLCEAIAAEFPHCHCIVGAVNDRPGGYDYPVRVRFEIDQTELASYRRAAEFLNVQKVDVVSIQHEFGIYGGPAGSHLLEFLRNVRMPTVTTLHTLLIEPNQDQRAVMKELDELSKRFIVMAERGKRLLEEIYGVAPQ